MPIGLAIGAGLGLAKSEFIDKPQNDIYNKLQAEKTRYAYRTHTPGGDIKQTDPIGTALQFGATGAQLGSNIATSAALAKYLNAGAATADATNPWAQGDKYEMGGQGTIDSSGQPHFAPWNQEEPRLDAMPKVPKPKSFSEGLAWYPEAAPVGYNGPYST